MTLLKAGALRSSFEERVLADTTVRKAPLLSQCHFRLKVISFYQDRLGTNTGKEEQAAVFHRLSSITGATSVLFLFWLCCCRENGRFAKTGSGQTNERQKNVREKTTVFRAAFGS